MLILFVSVENAEILLVENDVPSFSTNTISAFYSETDSLNAVSFTFLPVSHGRSYAVFNLIKIDVIQFLIGIDLTSNLTLISYGRSYVDLNSQLD